MNTETLKAFFKKNTKAVIAGVAGALIGAFVVYTKTRAGVSVRPGDTIVFSEELSAKVISVK